MTSARFCFDLDGVVVESPLFPLIARVSSYVEEVEVLTRASDEGLLPFESSLRVRCRLLDDLDPAVVSRQLDHVRYAPEIVDFIERNADRCTVVTSNLNVWVAKIGEVLGCDLRASSAAVGERGTVVPDTLLDKADVVEELRRQGDPVVAVGSGINDVGMLEEADIAVAYGVRPNEGVRSISDYWVTGGKGLCLLLASLS